MLLRRCRMPVNHWIFGRIHYISGHPLEAVQTPTVPSLKKSGKTLINHYAQVLIDSGPQISQISQYLAVDGYFSKKSFVDQIVDSTNLTKAGPSQNQKLAVHTAEVFSKKSNR